MSVCFLTAYCPLQALKKSADQNDTKLTFSDDEIPSDIDFNDPYFSSELLSASKKSKFLIFFINHKMREREREALNIRKNDWV